MKTDTQPTHKPSSGEQRPKRAPLELWARDRGHQERLAQQIARLRRGAHA